MANCIFSPSKSSSYILVHNNYNKILAKSFFMCIFVPSKELTNDINPQAQENNRAQNTMKTEKVNGHVIKGEKGLIFTSENLYTVTKEQFETIMKHLLKDKEVQVTPDLKFIY